MIDGKTFYQILGVLENAEEAVIRAAYKVLAQKYHPDKFEGDQAYATRRMQEISRAYEVLSSQESRQAYDDELRRTGFFESDIGGNDEEQLISDDEESWKLACEFRPGLVKLASDLRLLRDALENQFKALLLETRRFDIAEGLAEELRKSYLATYFGSNPEVQKFAHYLLTNKRRKDALILNKAVGIMGDSVKPEELIKYVNDRSEYKEKEESRSLLLAKMIVDTGKNYDWELCSEFLKGLAIDVFPVGMGTSVTTVRVGSGRKRMHVDEFVIWTKNNIAKPFIEGNGYFRKDLWEFL
jgi:curved DNA-binding protein CbpA